MAHQLDDDEVRNRIRETFVKCIAPDNIIWLFHKYDTGVLTEDDIQRVKAKTSTDGPMEGAQLLLNRLPLYKNWFPCLMKVLQDEHVKLGHVAKTMQAKLNSIDLLLIGKLQSGKSATGNAILGKGVFRSIISRFYPVTTNVQCEVSDFNGRHINVVDTPGVGDPMRSREHHLDRAIKAMEKAITYNPRGYHAFLLVLVFGERYTREDHDTVVFLKKIFGDDFVKKFCILVMTNGDCFDPDDGVTFKQWCEKQKGGLGELLRECNNRVILFDNKTEDERKKYQQVSDLITMVDNLQTQGHPYNCTNFEKAEGSRQRAMIEAKKPMIHDEVMPEISLICQKLALIGNKEDPEGNTKQMEILHKRTQNLLDVLQDKDQGTGALHDLVEKVKSLRSLMR